MIEAVSLFTGAGIGELFLRDTGINVKIANEKVEKRAKCYEYLHPYTKMVQGDIGSSKVKSKILDHIDSDLDLLIATPPCQGLSTLGKNKLQDQMASDQRNYLIFDALDIVDEGDFSYVLIENVDRFMDMYFPYQDSFLQLVPLLKERYGDTYKVDARILNAKDYGVGQTRPRSIIKLYKKSLQWPWPSEEKKIPLSESIGHLPSLEAGEDSSIKWHKAKNHNDRSTLALKHTPPGKSALENEVYYPKKKNGDRVKGFHNTYKRMKWDEPAPTRTTYCGSISSHNNVHPGREREDGTYTDARVLTLLETFLVTSIPEDIEFPDWASDNFIRTVIGECVPPLMLKKIMTEIEKLAYDLQS